MGIGLYRSYQFFLRRIGRFTCDLQVFGREHLIENGPLIIAANHASFFDPMLLGVTYDRPLSFMARESLFSASRFFSWVIRQTFAFPLKHGATAKDALRLFEERLKNDLAVVLFPEGTRSKDGRYVKSESAIGMLSTRSNAPIQPVYVMGSWHAWPRFQKYPRVGPMRVYVGPAIYPKANLARGDKRAEQNRLNAAYEQALLDFEQQAWREFQGES
ncbi:1-acyl-sn-glycerol-3-phosphate acyltransferase [Planctomycetales bacterium]|nr:1-acyl-sn-glycerol-3-phosphate acyltransferase [Planctomycetales bacterium]GHS97489.1 1-acyl-sn-glycerol-3-phosphate acyltransferase [Planctomycetales bacterium]GHV20473.1 1-acyl-sn-glycerol-3-phosphate acyltransferase [Planctomycetales bacterium]